MKVHLAKRNYEGRVTLKVSECGKRTSQMMSETIDILKSKSFNKWYKSHSDTVCCKVCLQIAFEQKRI